MSNDPRRECAKWLLACLRRRGITITASTGSKFTLAPAGACPDGYKAALKEYRAEVLALMEWEKHPLFDCDPNTRSIPYEQWRRRYVITAPTAELRDNRPEWAKPKAEQTPPAFGFYEPKAPCPNCQGVTFRHTAAGVWICPRCTPNYPKQYISRTITLQGKQNDAKAS